MANRDRPIPTRARGADAAGTVRHNSIRELDRRGPQSGIALSLFVRGGVAADERYYPNCLIEMAEMLVKAGYKTKAKAALEVVVLFPSYAHKFFGGSDNNGALANGIVNQARERLQTL
jgi:hypothetical protein